MIRATVTETELLKTEIWYDPRFHFDVGIGETRVPSETDEIRIESDSGTSLGLEFSVKSRLLTGFLCLTFRGRGNRGNAIKNEDALDIVNGCPAIAVELGSAELTYARPASSRNVFTMNSEILVFVPSDTVIQFCLGETPSKLIRVSENLVVGINEASAVTLIELSDVSIEATKHFLVGEEADQMGHVRMPRV